MAARIVAKCYSSVSTEAAGVLAGIPPLDLVIAKTACIRTLRHSPTARFLNSNTNLEEFDSLRHLKLYLEILIEDLWQNRWDSSHKGRTTYGFVPRVTSEPTCGLSDWNLTQILTGHGNFRQHLLRIGKTDEGDCPECTVLDDPIHRLLHCPIFEDDRINLLLYTYPDPIQIANVPHYPSELLVPFTGTLPDPP